jgi:hypothetical protein
MGYKRNEYKILVGKSVVKRLLGRPRRWWVDNIEIDLWEIGWDGVGSCGMDCTDVPPDRD